MRIVRKNTTSGCLLITLVRCMLLLFTSTVNAQAPHAKDKKNHDPLLLAPTERQLTFDTGGHLLNSTQCYSKDDSWIAYDCRNLETPIPANSEIRIVNTRSKTIKILYQTRHQSAYGPGVGAAAFSPVENNIIFIHGLRNCDKTNPYSFSRRTGVCVSIDTPGKIEFLDARNIIPPFTPGALRGGTHAYSWSGDGQWISFTYNDFIIEQASKKDSSLSDLRVVAVMNTIHPVAVPDTSNEENNNGSMFSVVVTKVTDHPKWGSDEIDKAFDEGWIGSHGYQKKDGSWQHGAIAFQGNVKDVQGKTKSEVFVADLPDNITQVLPGCPLEGTETTRPCPPAGVQQRRITFLDKGIQGPRYWLRSTADGKWIGFLAADKKEIIQIFLVSPNGGNYRQLTFNHQSVEGPFNFSPDGRRVAYIADSSVFITLLDNGRSQRVTPKSTRNGRPIGAVIWSNNGKKLAYNRYLKEKSGKNYLQIFTLAL